MVSDAEYAARYAHDLRCYVARRQPGALLLAVERWACIKGTKGTKGTEAAVGRWRLYAAQRGGPKALARDRTWELWDPGRLR